MKRIVALVVLIFVGFVVLNRQRIYVWDPIAKVTRDGLKVDHVRVMINYSNDVLLDDQSGMTRMLYLVQHWNQTAAYSTGKLLCVEFLACMADGDHATADRLIPGQRGMRPPVDGVSMTDRNVDFVDGNGALVAVTLR
jgi:hypothetical protein